MSETPPEFVPVAQAAQRYQVSQATLYALMRRGELTRYKRSGDKRTYLATTELERVLRPKPVDSPEQL